MSGRGCVWVCVSGEVCLWMVCLEGCVSGEVRVCGCLVAAEDRPPTDGVCLLRMSVCGGYVVEKGHPHGSVSAQARPGSHNVATVFR